MSDELKPQLEGALIGGIIGFGIGALILYLVYNKRTNVLKEMVQKLEGWQ